MTEIAPVLLKAGSELSKQLGISRLSQVPIARCLSKANPVGY